MSFLDNTGVGRLWAHIETKLNTKVDKVDGKVLSSNDYTTTEKNNLNTAYQHSQSPHAPSDAVAQAKNYTDGAVSGLQSDVADSLDSLATEIDGKVGKVSGKGLSTNDYTTAEKNKLSGIAAGAEVNQNAFSNITVGSTTIAADAKTDTLTLVAGSNVTITPDATNDKITIAATDTKYTHPTYTARTGVPTANATPGFGGTFTVSQPVSDGTGHITAVNSRTITIPNAVATTSAAGLMSATDKAMLNNLNTLVGDTAVSTQINNAVAQKSQVQIVTWESDD